MQRNVHFKTQKMQLARQQARLQEQDLMISDLQEMLRDYDPALLKSMREMLLEEQQSNRYLTERLENAPNDPWAQRLRKDLQQAHHEAAATEMALQNTLQTLKRDQDQDWDAMWQEIRGRFGQKKFEVLKNLWDAMETRGDKLDASFKRVMEHYEQDLETLGDRVCFVWQQFDKDVTHRKIPSQDPALRDFMHLVRVSFTSASPRRFCCAQT